MIVSRETFQEVLTILEKSPIIAVDCETTGLFPYKGDKLFSIIFATEAGQWYLNFQNYDGCPESLILGEEHFKSLQEKVFNDEKKLYYFHNAKFDLAFLSKVGIECRGRIHDTASMYRILDNEAFFEYSLDNCVKKALGIEKSDIVEEYLSEHAGVESIQIPGRKQTLKKKNFHEVPLDIISTYGLKDGEITYALGKWQREMFRKLENAAENEGVSGYIPLYLNESQLTKTVFNMEKRGVQIDTGYVQMAIAETSATMQNIEAEFKASTGKDYKESPTLFLEVFQNEKLVYGPPTKTGKINPSFDSRVLADFKHPAASLILRHRDIKSKNDFFKGFAFFCDDKNILHTNFNQGGTVTGRFSSSNPNLQNLEKNEGDELLGAVVVRRAIVPRPGFFFAMFDFEQMEYRLMLDLAGATGLITKVLGGLDVHQATADEARITRSQAKTVNFGLLYGQGDTALSESLKVSLTEAQRLRKLIFDAAPEIKNFIDSQKNAAEYYGEIINWFGRRNKFPKIKMPDGKLRRMVHKAANSAIQGGCADIVKIAMNKIDCFLGDKKSKLVLMIHDELVIETHESEKHILPEIKNIMESVYPYQYLPLTCGIDYSYKSLADKTPGFPE